MSRIGPVCVIEVNAKSVAASHALDGTTYLFFFDHCFNPFSRHPERYSDRIRPSASPNWHNDVGCAADHVPEGLTPSILT